MTTYNYKPIDNDRQATNNGSYRDNISYLSYEKPIKEGGEIYINPIVNHSKIL